ncbi:MAG: hypothetical protein JRD89_03795 [Deltaproteobacteria bacterium]|nr:hypothetical protein [Deltaproteobacteria bacterium]
METLTEERIEEIARAAAREVIDQARLDVTLFIHHIPEVHGTPGIVVDEARAKATPCNCFTYRDKDYCYSPGIIGMMDPDQVQAYCPTKQFDTVRPGIKERFAKFREAAEEAHKKIEAIPKGERLIPWLEAMSQSLAKRGIEI